MKIIFCIIILSHLIAIACGYQKISSRSLQHKISLPITTRSFLTKLHFIKQNSRTPTKNYASVTWQEDVDKFLDIDTSMDTRRNITSNLLQRFNEISKDVVSAVRDRDIEKLAPSSLTYGKNLKSAQAFRQQLIQDIIPDLITQRIPKVIAEGPKIAKKLMAIDPSKISQKGSTLLEKVKDISQDPSALQSTVDDARKEFKNIFKSTPEGLFTPQYEVIKSTPSYEIRKYPGFSVCSTSMSSSSTSTEPSTSEDSSDGCTTNSFNMLATYLFGENANADGKSEALSMTTPVIMGDGKMEFVLPKGLTASSAPVPLSGKVALEDVSEMIVAVKEFSGLATDKETAKQRAVLEDALLADGLVYDNLSFKTFQYNPPQTLPWLRRNEAILKVFLPVDFDFESSGAAEGTENSSASEVAVPEIIYESTPPEAGD